MEFSFTVSVELNRIDGRGGKPRAGLSHPDEAGVDRVGLAIGLAAHQPGEPLEGGGR